MNDPLEITKCDISFQVKTESEENQFEIKTELVEEIKFDTESSLNASHISDNKLDSKQQLRKVRGPNLPRGSQNAEAKKERNRVSSRKCWAGLSDEKLEAKRKTQRERNRVVRAGLNEEEAEAKRKRQREKAREFRACQSDEQIEERRKRQRERKRESFTSLSEEKLEAQRKKQRERARESFTGLSEEKLEAQRKRQRERAREFRAGQSDEQLEERRKRQRERLRELRAGQNEEEAEARKKRRRERAREAGSERTEDQYQEEMKLRAKRVKLSTHKVLSCDVCERKFSDTNNLNTHNRSHYEKYCCAMCDKTYTLSESLGRHIKLFHAEGYPDLEDGIGEFKCNLCSETFTQTKKFKAHKKSHSKDTKILYTTEFKLEAVKKVREVGVSKVAAELSISTGTITKWFCLIFNPLYCTYCSKIFADQANLNVHEETHTKDPLYCAYCSKSFANKGSLKVHENAHTKDSQNKPKKERIRIKKYSCNQCFKMFLCPGHIERHLRNFNGCSFKSELSLRELYFQKYDTEDATCTDGTKEMMGNEGLMEVKKDEHKSLQDSNQDGQATEGHIKANKEGAEDNCTNFANEETTSFNYQEETDNISNSNTDTLGSLNDNDDMTDEEAFVRDMAELENSKHRGTDHEACIDSDEHESASETEATCLVKIETAEDVTEANINKREMGYIDQLIKVEENSFKHKIENCMEENEDDHMNDNMKLEDDLEGEINKQVHTIKIRKIRIKKLQCDKCSSLFLKPSQLIRHKKTSIYLSNTCMKVKIKNNRDKELEHIKQVDGTFQCTLCCQAWDTMHTTVFKTVYKTLNQTVNHVKSCHPEVNPQYQCEICAKQFYFPTKYNLHMRSYHIEKEDGKIKGHDGQELVKREAMCDLCGKGFTCKRSVKNHMFAAHTSKEEKDAARSFFCSFCGKGFFSKDGLQEHERLHAGVKNIKCPDCPKAFKQNACLRSHVRRLHNESGKPFMSEEKKAKYKAYMVKYNAKYNAEKRAKKNRDLC